VPGSSSKELSAGQKVEWWSGLAKMGFWAQQAHLRAGFATRPAASGGRSGVAGMQVWAASLPSRVPCKAAYSCITQQLLPPDDGGTTATREVAKVAEDVMSVICRGAARHLAGP